MDKKRKPRRTCSNCKYDKYHIPEPYTCSVCSRNYYDNWEEAKRDEKGKIIKEVDRRSAI